MWSCIVQYMYLTNLLLMLILKIWSRFLFLPSTLKCTVAQYWTQLSRQLSFLNTDALATLNNHWKTRNLEDHFWERTCFHFQRLRFLFPLLPPTYACMVKQLQCLLICLIRGEDRKKHESPEIPALAHNPGQTEWETTILKSYYWLIFCGKYQRKVQSKKLW